MKSVDRESEEICEEDVVSFTNWLVENSIPFQERVRVDKISQIKAGGLFRVVVRPESEDQLVLVIRELAFRRLPHKLIGNLSNTLFRDGEIKTVTISLKWFRRYSFDPGGFVTAEAGLMLPTLAKLMVRRRYKGFAGLVGVPGTVGGAVFMNASCYNDGISDYLHDVRCLDHEGIVRTIPAAELGFSWRRSAFHESLTGFTILSARFKLVAASADEESQWEKQIRTHRKTYQENEYPNLGSTFATKDIYSEISNHFFGFKCALFIVRGLTKYLPGDRHHNYAFLARKLVLLYFHLRRVEEVDYSNSTFNCVVNRGSATANQLIDFVLHTQSAIDNCVPLEIEILKDIK